MITTSEYFKGINLVHRILLIGALLSIIISVVLNQLGVIEPSDDFYLVMMILSPLIGLWGIFGSQFIFSRMIKNGIKEGDLSNKMAAYRGASLLRDASLESAAIFGAVALLVSGSLMPLGIAVVCTAYLASLKPDKTKIKKILELTPTEAMKLDQDDAEIMDPLDIKEHYKGGY